ncbi:hypothetical protein D3C73_1604210 [compost metagenome]
MIVWSSFVSFSLLKAREPLFAIVPRFSSSSSFVIPIPVSVIVNVRASLSTVSLMK